MSENILIKTLQTNSKNLCLFIIYIKAWECGKILQRCQKLKLWILVSLKKKVISSAKRVSLISSPFTRKPFIFLSSLNLTYQHFQCRDEYNGERGSPSLTPHLTKNISVVKPLLSTQVDKFLLKILIHWTKFGPKRTRKWGSDDIITKTKYVKLWNIQKEEIKNASLPNLIGLVLIDVKISEVP